MTTDSEKPTLLYHATTPAKARKYSRTGAILRPVRGFDTLEAAKAWAWKTGRTVIYEVPTQPGQVHKLPDHHKRFGCAWWIDRHVLVSERSVACSRRAVWKGWVCDEDWT